MYFPSPFCPVQVEGVCNRCVQRLTACVTESALLGFKPCHTIDKGSRVTARAASLHYKLPRSSVGRAGNATEHMRFEREQCMDTNQRQIRFTAEGVKLPDPGQIFLSMRPF